MKKKLSYLTLFAMAVSLLAGCSNKPVNNAPTAAPTATTAVTEPLKATATPNPAATAEPTGTPAVTEPLTPVITESTTPTETPALTELPVSPEATETPLPTATTAPTIIPEPTNTPTATPVPTAIPVPTATPVPEPTKAPAGKTITYDFSDMTYLASYGTQYSVHTDGSATLQYEGIYQEVKFAIPEGINMKYCHKVTLKAKSEYGPISYKLYGETVLSDPYCGEIAVKYDCIGDGIVEYELTPELNTTVYGIGIMASGLADTYSYANYKAAVYSITFHMDTDFTPTPTPTPFIPDSTDGATLLNTYGKAFGYMGTCINLSQLQNSSTLAQVKTQYNSITLENEMKPDAMLGWSATLISVEQAKDMGYVIPDNYTESYVPQINFSSVDRALEICSKNGLSMRAHTLVWHSQTPNWFFRTGYSASGSFVSKAEMDARMEFYIRTVMTHIYNGEYGSVIYSWDIVNEYLHADETNWKAVYGDMGLKPTFVKKAYEIADDVLRSFGIRNKVSLLFNDFNTYMEVNEILSVVDYINSDKKVCDGIGMQAHLSTDYPSATLFKNTLQTFLSAGLEVQITELDVGNSDENTQAEYLYELMSYILGLKKNGGTITGITYWGLSDDVSWRKDNAPLLFSGLTSPKKSYYQVLQAYVDAGYRVGK